MPAGASGRYSHSKHWLPHAIRHFVRQLMFGGHHRFYNTSLSEYTHQLVVKWAGSRVRKRGHNQTHTDMGFLVWENAILAKIGGRHTVATRPWMRRQGDAHISVGPALMHSMCRLNSFVHQHIPITWGEAASFVSCLFGTRQERGRGAVATERANLFRLRWTWSTKCTVLRGGTSNIFKSGDVVRFRGTEGVPATALVGKVRHSLLCCSTERFCRTCSTGNVL